MDLQGAERLLVAAVEREDFRSANEAIERYRSAFDEAFKVLPDQDKAAFAQAARGVMLLLLRRAVIARCRITNELLDLPPVNPYGSAGGATSNFLVRY